MTKIVVLLLLLGIGTYWFQTYGVAEKFGRFVTIMGNIAYNLQHAKHNYEDVNISDEELKEINITKISSEMKSLIDKKKS